VMKLSSRLESRAPAQFVNGFVDIHAHLLPGIDDGPKDVVDALEMARAAAAASTVTLAATPHLRADFPNVEVHELADRCRTLGEIIVRERIPLRIVSGAEVSLVWALEASDEQLVLASYGQRGTDLLIETPGDVAAISQNLYVLRYREFRITLAHPERSREFQRNPAHLELLGDQGVLLQVNAQSLLLPRRNSTRKLAEHLCRNGRAHVLASDGHRAASRRRVSALADGVKAAGALVGDARARWMACGVPEAILAGEPLPEAPAIEPGRRRLWGS
jgi:protein-tyrosine phosphatase